MTSYVVTTSNWNSPAFWSGISESGLGHTLDFSGLPSNFTISYDLDTDSVTISDGSTSFVVGDTDFVGTPDASLGGTTIWDYFTTLAFGDGDQYVSAGYNGEIITTGSGNDTIFSNAGADSVNAGDGDNIVYSGPDNDTVVTGTGADQIFGGDGNDSLSSGDGVDFVDGGSGADIIYGGGGADQLEGGWGDNASDTIWAGAGNDLVFLTGGNDFGYGEDGADWIDGGWGADSIEGGAGVDRLLGDKENDTIRGGDGADILTGGAGTDTLDGGGDDDQIWGAAGDFVDGGETGFDNDVLNVANVSSVSYSGAESGTVFFNGGGSLSFQNIENVNILTNNFVVDGTSGNDQIGQFYVDADGDWIDNDDAPGGGEQDSVLAGAGDDTVWANEGNDTIVGGDGSDAIYGGGSDDLIYGGDGNLTNADDLTGNDTLWGGDGADTIYGEGGDDSISGEGGSNALYGGTGNDTINGGWSTGSTPSFTDVANGNVATGTTGTDYFRWLAEPAANATIIVDDGTGGDRTGDGAADYIVVATTNTTNTLAIRGFDYNTDKIVLQEPYVSISETATPRGGDDWTYTATITYSSGNTQQFNIEGEGPGPVSGDQIFTTTEPWTGADYIEGNEGNDWIQAFGGDDTVLGGDGNDTIDDESGTGNGNGDDFFDGGAGDDYIWGGVGNDTLIGGTGSDTATGEEGDDSIEGGDDADTFYYFWDAGNDTVWGGEGGTDLDTLDFQFGGEAYFINYTGAEQGTFWDDAATMFVTFQEIEALTLSDQNDTINGDNDTSGILAYGMGGNDSMRGGSGSDTFYSGDGIDSLDGQGGDDLLIGNNSDGVNPTFLTGGAGADTLDGTGGNWEVAQYFNDTLGGVNIDLTDGLVESGGTAAGDSLAGIEQIDGTNLFGDTLTGGTDTHELKGWGGNDSITLNTSDWGTAYGGDGSDTITGGAGNDTLDGDDAFGTGGIDVIFGGAGNDQIIGDVGGDSLYGQTGSDTIYAGDGNDVVDGGSGADSIYGGIGQDTLSGADGADTISGGDGNDQITAGSGDSVTGDSGDDTFFVGPGDLNGTALSITGGETGETAGDTLDITGPATINMTGAEAGTVTWLDGTVLTFSEIENVNYTPCFTPGTRIKTARGEIDAADITIGDRVLTRDHGYQTVRWCGQKTIDSDMLHNQPALRPVLIRQGTLGQGLPERDLLISPQHRVMMSGPMVQLVTGEDEVLVPAIHLVGRTGIEQIDTNEVTYVHFMFDGHELVMSDGAWTESFQPGELSLSALDAAQRAELFRIFPELADSDTCNAIPAARVTLKKHETVACL